MKQIKWWIVGTILAGFGPLSSLGAGLATDTAADAAYAGGWVAGNNGGSGWGGAWTFSTVGTAGSFAGTSVSNGFDQGGIDTGNKAWALFGNSGGRINALRPFNGWLNRGQSFKVRMDNGFVGAGGKVGVRLLDAMDASAIQWDFYFAGGLANYQFRDAGSLFGVADSGIPYTDAGLELQFTLTGPTNFTLQVITLADGVRHTFSGTLSDADPILGVSLYNDNAGLGPDYDAFFNQAEILYDLPAPVRASDHASDSAYASGWADGSNGGTGFGPWIFLNSIENAGEAAGQFLAVNDPLVADNDDLNCSTSGVPPKAWAMYANEGSTGDDNIQIAAAYRSLTTPLAVGETLSIDFEHGGVQGGSLNANVQPRTGGFVGFALRTYAPPLQFDPDPFNAFASLNNASFACGFRGGFSNYQVYDLSNPSGFDTGLPYTTDGIRVTFTVTSTTTYSLVMTQLGSNPQSVSFNNRSLNPGTPLAYIGLFDRNAEENDTFFNNLSIVGSWDTDADMDGMADLWENENGLNSTTNDAAVDTDLDGDSNLAEYLADTNPGNSNDYFLVSYPGPENGDTVSFPASSIRAYTLEYVDHPTNATWSSHPSQIGLLGNGGILTLTNPATAPLQRHYRVKVQVP